MTQQIENYQKFFLDQANEQQRDYRKIRYATMKQLFREEKVCYAIVDHINNERGHIVLKFKKGYAPRLKVLRSFVLIYKGAREKWGDFPPLWECIFNDFIKSKDNCSPYSDITPLYFLNRNDEGYDYVGCSSVSLEMFSKIKAAIEAKKTVHVLIFEPEPPTAYFFNLKNYIEQYSFDKDLLIKPVIKYEDWHPEELAFNPDDKLSIQRTVLNSLQEEHCVILQGPPGTGKSYTIAHVIAQYLKDSKTVCVTTMANKGLVELITQPPLKEFLEAGKLYKTLLTADEFAHARGLKKASKDMIVNSGEALFSTNYKLSMLYAPEKRDALPSYDLVVIEEASQAYLTTIAAFKKLGRNCLIVGDPMQLPPIVMNNRKSDYKIWNADIQADGLTTYALGSGDKSFRITTTFRLTEPSAKLTGLFYSNSLKSVRKELVDFSDLDPYYFPKEGGVLYQVVSGATNGISSKAAIGIIERIIGMLERNYPKSTLAIISPFKDTIKNLQSKFYTDRRKIDITVETIDRVQGITVDYAILYFPLRNIGFALDERRFNVATSRSRSTTLIISDIPLTKMLSIPPRVSTFIKQCKTIGDNMTATFKDEASLKEVLSRNDVKVLYPGLEEIVDLLLDNNVPFSHEGDVDLMDKDGVVIATAGMLLKEYNIAIDPVDDDSKKIFERAGYKVISSNDFSIELLKR